ncbi:MAG: hypothetical protein HXS44_15690 [Theionarchaea archaeon]|nr:hypothetical protein [Theionarchaea archaeon]
MPPKWFLIAKNEYFILTSGIREIRSYFPLLVIGALAGFIFYIAPKIVDLFLDELLAFLLSQVAVVLMQVMLFMFFFIFITLPISYTLRDIRAEQQWLFLSAPIKASDLLLGEFLGELPLYAILITIIAGFFTVLLNPLGIDIVQKVIIILIFIIVLSSALWIGTVLAALLRTRLGKTASGRDIGKALSILIVIPIVAVMYALMGGGMLETLADPGTSGMVKMLLGWLPSTWGADIINSFVLNPGNTTAVLSGTLLRFGSIILFSAVTLVIGVRVADRAYNLEATTFTAAKVHPDGIFYKTIKSLGGGKSFGTLLVSVFKVYSRRLQNLSWLFYVVILVAMINLFIVKPEDPFGVIMMSSFAFAMLAAVVASDVTLRGKETLFIYKKIPSGVGLLLKTRLLQGWLVIIPVSAAIIMIALSRVPDTPFLSVLAYTGFVILIAAANMTFALGIFLLMPAYTEKGGEFMLNLMIIIQASIFLFIGCIIIFGLLKGMLVMALASWSLGGLFIFLGKRKLANIE